MANRDDKTAATDPDAPATVPEPVVDAEDHTGQLLNAPPANTPHVHTDTSGGWRLATGEEASDFAEQQEKAATEAAKTGSAETAGGATGGATTPPRGTLPDDFPGKAALDAADLGTYGKVRAAIKADTLTDTNGIGPATAKKIQDAIDAATGPEQQ